MLRRMDGWTISLHFQGSHGAVVLIVVLREKKKTKIVFFFNNFKKEATSCGSRDSRQKRGWKYRKNKNENFSRKRRSRNEFHRRYVSSLVRISDGSFDKPDIRTFLDWKDKS